MKTYYTNDHEYIIVDNGTGTVGITDYAQNALGDVVYAETPKVGVKLAKGDAAGVVESVKSASELFSPVSGEVTAANAALSNPAIVNTDAEGAAWFYMIRLSDESELEELMDAEAYKKLTQG
jgi:glycine cleavage system H protein